MWHSPKGQRIVEGSEAKLVSEAVLMMVDELASLMIFFLQDFPLGFMTNHQRLSMWIW